jgi:hypothetical protein
LSKPGDREREFVGVWVGNAGDREREQWEEVRGQVSRGRANGLANTLFCLVPAKRLEHDRHVGCFRINRANVSGLTVST